MAQRLLWFRKGVAAVTDPRPHGMISPTTTLLVIRPFSSNYQGGGGGASTGGSSSNNNTGGGDNPTSQFKIPRPPMQNNDGPRHLPRAPRQSGPTMEEFARDSGLLPHKNPLLRSHFIKLFPEDYGDEEDSEGDDDDDDDYDDDFMDDGEDEDSEEFIRMNRMLAQLDKARQEQAKKQARWEENAKTPVRFPVIDNAGRSYGRGARKAARARVWITPGFGHITVNRQDFVDYFPRMSHRQHLLEPLVATETCGQFDIQCRVQGGGLSGQAGAVRLGVARALVHWNPDLFRNTLKRGGFMTRDPRVVESKKIGRVKARKRPQWNRR